MKFLLIYDSPIYSGLYPSIVSKFVSIDLIKDKTQDGHFQNSKIHDSTYRPHPPLLTKQNHSDWPTTL